MVPQTAPMHFFHANPFMPEMDASPRDRSLCPRKSLAVLSHFFLMKQRVGVKVTIGLMKQIDEKSGGEGDNRISPVQVEVKTKSSDCHSHASTAHQTTDLVQSDELDGFGRDLRERDTVP